MRNVPNTRPPAAAALIAALLLGAPAAMQATHAQTQAPAPAPVEGRASAKAPESRVEAAQAVDAALAAALIGSISGQFDERGVEVKLDHVRTEPLNLVDLDVQGEGRLRLGSEGEWLPLRFHGLYDGVALSMEQPRITIGADGKGDELPASSVIGVSLQKAAQARLQREFAQQPATLQLDRVTRIGAGTHLARVEASGSARFDEGATPVTVDGLYDTRDGRWLRVVYELSGTTAGATPPAVGEVAASAH